MYDEEIVGDEDVSDDDEEFPFVHDDYDPYAGCKWSDNFNRFESYFDRVFHNGELYHEDEAFGSVQLRSWMLFCDKKYFKMVFREYYVQEGFTIVVNKVDKNRYTVEYASEGCPFRIHGSCLPNGITWAIKSMHNIHNYTRIEDHNPMASYKWVAEKLLDDIRANNDILVRSLNVILFERYGIIMKKCSAYLMKSHAMEMINGGFDTSYSKLPSYCEVIKETNLGSVAHCAWVEGQPVARTADAGNDDGNEPEKPLVFKYIFISFKPEFERLIKGCRGLIGVDGTHLKGNYGGVLLSAVVIDVKNELFPIANAILDSESKHTWSNFFLQLKHTLKDSERDDWIVV